MDRLYTGSRLQRVKRLKKTACCKWVLIVTERFNMTVNYLDAKKSSRYCQVLVVSERFVSGIQCKCSCMPCVMTINCNNFISFSMVHKMK